MSNLAIKVEDLTKIYRLYDKPIDRLKESLNPFGKKYHKDFYALKGVNLEIKKGESVGIIGKNGSGKSTFLKIISGVLTPTCGKITVSGSVSALLELSAGFNRRMTGIENVYFNGTLLGFTRAQMDAKIAEILDFADIGEHVYQPVSTYSSGMFVRLAFALKTSVEPDLMIVDEALSVGDFSFRQKCFDRLADLRARGLTWVLVSHDLQSIKNHCDRCFYLKRGQIVMEGSPEIVTERYLKDSFEERQKTTKDSGTLEWKIDNGKARFGTGKAKILETSIGTDGDTTTVFHYGDTIEITVKAFVDHTILNPDIVIQLRDHRGYAIYGVRSWDLTQEESLLRNVDRHVKAAFSFKVSLAPGKYALAIAINDQLDNDHITVHEKIAGALSFTILKGKKNFHGVVDLKANCHITSQLVDTTVLTKATSS